MFWKHTPLCLVGPFTNSSGSDSNVGSKKLAAAADLILAIWKYLF